MNQSYLRMMKKRGILINRTIGIIYGAFTHKSNTKVDDYSPKNMEDDVKIYISSYLPQYVIFASYKNYDWMHTATFDVNSYRPCACSFYDEVFFHNGCTFEE